jgi:Lon protease-like protein
MSFAQSQETLTIPLFPLGIVLFPGGRHDLQIFEQRYIDMVTSSLKNDTPFGLCSLQSGQETRAPGTRQSVSRIGTLARIIDWNSLDNGLLGITIEGTTKFRVDNCWQAESDLLMAEVTLSAEDRLEAEPVAFGEGYEALVEVLKGLEGHPLVAEKNLAIDHDNLWHLGWHLSELMPLDGAEKQGLLELDDAQLRADRLLELLRELSGEDS